MAGPNIIDELVVELGIDATKFTAGQKLAVDAAKKAAEQLAKIAKDEEERVEKMMRWFGKLKMEAVGLATALVGAVGVKDFIQNVTQNDSALFRFSQTIGRSTKEVSAWDMTFQKFTGSAGEGAAMFDKITQASSRALLHGDQSWFVIANRALMSVNMTLADLQDKSGAVSNVTELMFRLNEAFSRMAPHAARGFAAELGISDDQLYVLRRAAAELHANYEEMKRLAAINDEMGAKSQRVIEQWNRVSSEIGRGLREIWYSGILGPILDGYQYLEKLLSGKKGTDNTANAMRSYLYEGGMEPEGGGGGHVGNMPIPSFTPRAGAPGAGGLPPAKPGAGTPSVSTLALSQVLSASVPGYKATAYADDAHRGWESQHNEGRALDFTLAGGAGAAAAVSAALRKKLADMGIDATVLDEYNHKSAHWTGPHVHVQFNSATAASQFAIAARSRSGGAAGGGGVTIGEINVYSQAGSAEGIARDIRGAIERSGINYQQNSGFQ